MPVTPPSPPGEKRISEIASIAEQFRGFGVDDLRIIPKELKLLRLQHSSQLRKITQLVEDVTATPVTAVTYNAKQQYLKDLKTKQNQIFDQILALSPDDAEEDFDIDETCGKLYMKLDTLIANGTPSEVPNVSTQSVQQSPQLKIPMPTFDGTYEQWPMFKAMFMDIVHRCGTSDAVKLHHLNKALVGKASGIINASVIASNNFSSAWQLLEDRYENPRAIVDRHIAGLLHLKPVTKESAGGLRELMDTCKTHIDGLAFMKKNIDGTSDLFITHILASCFDPETKKLWERTMVRGQFPELKSTLEFLCRQCEVLDQCANDKGERSKKPGSSVFTTSVQSCKFCRSDQHNIHQCPEFSALSLVEKQKKVHKLQLCYNCLGSGHSSANCESKRTCRKCNKRHNTLLHFETLSQAAKPDNVATTSRQQHPTTSSSSSGSHTSPQIVLSVNSEAKSTVLLSTVVINVMDDQGVEHQARALLDSGAQTNFIAGRLAQRLRLPRKTVNIPLSGIGGSTNINVRHSVRATIRSRCSTDTFTLEMLVLSKPTVTLPTQPVNISNWNIPENYILADPTFNQPGRVDMILGAELFYEYLLDRRVSFGLHYPMLQESKFGWIVSGSTPIEATSPSIVCATVVNNIDTLMQKFFEIEDLSSTPSWSIEEQACEDFFVDTTTRDSSGKYIVRLPRKPHTIGTLGESRSIALRRFLAIERRLQREPETRKAYTDFMEEYLRLGHMSKVSTHNEPMERYYLPHHPVFKVDSTTTKCRVVFDASSKTSNGLSLNDTLMVGPTIQQDATSILMRFRTHSIALTADIAKMYRQVWVHEDDRALQRILWRSSPSEPIEEYELSTVTYGTASAPFLAIRSLNQTSKDHGHQFPAAANRSSDFYVDDFVSGDRSVESAKNLQAEIEQLYAKGGFLVRKWASNDLNVLSAVDKGNLATSPFATSDDEGPLATLGVVWTPSSDVLQFKVGTTEITEPLTKRKVSSCIAQIYDPLGIVDPVKAVAKQLLQHIWSLKKDNSQPWGWDDELPPTLQQQWAEFQNQLVNLKQLSVPRVAISCDATEVQFHFFCDASEQGYGACCYLRSINKTGEINMHLFASKTKVTPLKVKHSIARLELCAAHLSGQLYELVQKAAQYTFPAVFWTDSMTVIHWLRSPPSRWKPFVGNRVSQIQQLTEGSSWRHISGVDNPADLASRGCSSTDLLNSSLWWRGPSWICLPENEWPQTPLSYNSQIIEEEQRTSTLACPVTEVTPNRIFTLYSSYYKLQRMMAYWVQFFNRRYHRRTYDKMGLTTTDLKDAEQVLHRLAQQDCFKSEFKLLQRNEPVPASSKLRWINPTVGPDGIIRVGGRLENSSLPDSAKHPVVILGSHPLAGLLMKQYHLTQLHAGPQLMLSISRQQYWIINGRNLARKIHHECFTCFRARPPSTHTIMADLPSGRVIAARPFSTCGVDYCGPILVKGSHRRAVPTKAYIAIFVCFITRAVHIELVSNLTTEAFVSALRRFVARRGLPAEIHSDNATNFKGASNQLNEIYQMLHSEQQSKMITSWALENGICWKFIPPRAPHFGGLWEAAVKSMKTHLVRVVGTSNLSFEDMTTLLAEIECCLNSRPITPLTDDPSDVNALTPGHFLIGAHLKDVPDNASTTIPTNRLNHWQQVQQLKRHFWDRWHREYLQLFHVRSKWMKEIDNKIDIGTLVLVKDENSPSTRWPLARVVELHPGKDGILRVATVVTSKGTSITRPIVKLCVLPKLH